MRLIRRMAAAIAITVSIIIIHIVIVYADTVTCWGSVDDSNSTVDMLIDLMVNDEAYDPLDQYAVIRTGEREYRLYFGRDLAGDQIVRYIYTPAYLQQQAQLTRSRVDNLTINRAGYLYVGNTPEALSSIKATQYKFYTVGVVTAVLILVLMIMRHLRRRRGTAPDYTVR